MRRVCVLRWQVLGGPRAQVLTHRYFYGACGYFITSMAPCVESRLEMSGGSAGVLSSSSAVDLLLISCGVHLKIISHRGAG